MKGYEIYYNFIRKHGQPPITKYTFKENAKHKKFNKNLKPLWYLEND